MIRHDIPRHETFAILRTANDSSERFSSFLGVMVGEPRVESFAWEPMPNLPWQKEAGMQVPIPKKRLNFTMRLPLSLPAETDDF